MQLGHEYLAAEYNHQSVAVSGEQKKYQRGTSGYKNKTRYSWAALRCALIGGTDRTESVNVNSGNLIYNNDTIRS